MNTPTFSHLPDQRDYFGAHTYERVDKPRGEFFHTNWTGTGGTVSASTYDAPTFSPRSSRVESVTATPR